VRRAILGGPCRPDGGPRGVSSHFLFNTPAIALEVATSEREKMVRFLRDKADQFRRIGMAHDTPLSARVFEIASDLEAQADELDAKPYGTCPERRPKSA
jgi:hypothetical protein